MTENNEAGLRKIRRALISVSDKAGIVDFARQLEALDVEIISTGGTSKILRDAGIDVSDVSELTGFPEMMDGRVKTLHPKVHGGLLSVRDNPDHQAAMRDHGIEPIDLVVVNLYPFEETIEREGVTLEQAIEQIDIGGPAMIRSAAKNYRDVAVVTSPELYKQLHDEMVQHGGALTLATRSQLARLAFMRTAFYDSTIFPYLQSQFAAGGPLEATYAPVPEVLQVMTTYMNLFTTTMKALHHDEGGNGHAEEFELHADIPLKKISDLRYGENPHQSAALYEIDNNLEELPPGLAHSELLSGKEMSFNNYVDADAAWQLVWDFEEPACAIIKHTNPAGVGLGESLEEAYRKALATDPVSAFGGIVAFNGDVLEEAARTVIEIFTEVIVAPGYHEDALKVLGTKKNLRVLLAAPPQSSGVPEYRQVSGGMLLQTRDTHKLSRNDLKVVSKRAPTEDEINALLFAWTVCKHTKSNAIVYARAGQTVGVGAGQMSRVDSVKLGAMRAQLPVNGSVMASDAFLPFRDGIDEAAKHGITAVIQPGGSKRDAAVIEACDEQNIAMVFTGIRHFKH